MIFNLAEYLGLTKEAMGAAAFKNRDPLDFWSLEKLEKAEENPQDPSIQRWNEWIQSVPTLANIVPNAQIWRSKYLKKMQDDYGVPYDVGNKILKLFVGYEPKSGGYITFVGPYFSKGYRWGQEHVREGAIGKFTFSTLAYAPNNMREAIAALDKKVSLINNEYEATSQGEPTGLAFDASDFTLVDRDPPRKNDSGKLVKGNITLQIDNLQDLRELLPNPNNDPEIAQQNEEIRQHNNQVDPNWEAFFGENRVTTNAEYRLNKEGYDKLMTGLMGPFYEEELDSRIQQKINNGATPEDARAQTVIEYGADDVGLSNMYKSVRKRWKDAYKDPTNPMHNEVISKIGLGYPEPPTFASTGLTKSSGQQWPREVKTTSGIEEVIDFRLKILDLVKNGISDVDEIDQVINAGRADKYKIPTSRIASELDKIAEIRVIVQEEGLQGTYEEIGQKLKEYKDGLTSHGFPDFRTAFEMMSAHFNSPAMLKLEDKNNLQVKDISEISRVHGDGEDAEEVTDEELDIQLGEGGNQPQPPQIQEEMPQQERVEVQPPQPQLQPQTRQRTRPQQPVVEDEEDDREVESLLDLIGNTLRGLIKVAKELDSEGKGEAAEEVHKVIRKYQKRIR